MYRIGPYRFSPTDALRTFRHLGDLWSHAVHGIASVPEPALVAGRAVADRLAARADIRALMGSASNPHLNEPGDLLRRTGEAAAELLSSQRWDTPTVVQVLDDTWSGIRQVGYTLRAASGARQSGHGTAVGLHRSDGGVPKQPCDSIVVNWSGVVGDRQASRRHHGSPWQALCLWSAEVISDLQRAGHPVRQGAAGENITLAGIDWPSVRPGAQLRIGTTECEVTTYAIPCAKNARWFRDGDFRIMHHERNPFSRVYAVVTTPGQISIGDVAVVVR